MDIPKPTQDRPRIVARGRNLGLPRAVKKWIVCQGKTGNKSVAGMFASQVAENPRSTAPAAQIAPAEAAGRHGYTKPLAPGRIK